MLHYYHRLTNLTSLEDAFFTIGGSAVRRTQIPHLLEILIEATTAISHLTIRHKMVELQKHTLQFAAQREQQNIVRFASNV